MYLCGDFFILLPIFGMKPLRLPRRSIIYLESVWHRSVTMWKKANPVVISVLKCSQRPSIIQQYFTSGLFLCFNGLFCVNDEGKFKIKPKGNHCNWKKAAEGSPELFQVCVSPCFHTAFLICCHSPSGSVYGLQTHH